MHRRDRLLTLLSTHWLAGLVYGAILAAWLAAPFEDAPHAAKVAFLAFVSVVLPTLYHMSVNRSGGTLVSRVRSLGLALSAVSLCGWFVFDRGDLAFRLFGALQWGLVAVIVAIEIAFTVRVTMLVFGSRPDRQVIADSLGAPEWVVRLMILEAEFWKRVFGAVGRVLPMRRSRGLAVPEDTDPRSTCPRSNGPNHRVPGIFRRSSIVRRHAVHRCSMVPDQGGLGHEPSGSQPAAVTSPGDRRKPLRRLGAACRVRVVAVVVGLWSARMDRQPSFRDDRAGARSFHDFQEFAYASHDPRRGTHAR